MTGSGAGGGSTAKSSTGSSSDVVMPSYVNASSSGAGGCSNDQPDPSWGVPNGWVRPPGSPCECEIYMSPDAEHMRAPSPWVGCGDGCFELVRDWSNDTSYTFGGVHGVSQSTSRRIAYKRYLTPTGPYELQIVRLPENIVVFDAWQRAELGPWFVDTLALSRDRALTQVWKSTDNTAKHWNLLYALDPSPAAMKASLVYDEVVSYLELETAASADLWAISFQPPHAWKWHGSAPSNQLQPGYSTPGYVGGLEASGPNLFFDTHTSVDDIMVFDPVGGNRKLVTFASAQVGGACGLRTDGKDMAWYQGGPISGKTYSSVDLVAAPFATFAADIVPHVVRPAYQNFLDGCGGLLGGGYHLSREVHDSGANQRVVLTRLSDGNYWILAPRPGRNWAELLYVDAEELAIVETLTGKFTHGDWTIVRRTIASLGPPRPPGSGFDP